LPADAITALSRTTTQPIGTSPDFPAFSAAFSAKSMKDDAVMPRLAGKTLLGTAHSAKVDTGFA
jgi:hypothetical protein